MSLWRLWPVDLMRIARLRRHITQRLTVRHQRGSVCPRLLGAQQQHIGLLQQLVSLVSRMAIQFRHLVVVAVLGNQSLQLLHRGLLNALGRPLHDVCRANLHISVNIVPHPKIFAMHKLWVCAQDAENQFVVLDHHHPLLVAKRANAQIKAACY